MPTDLPALRTAARAAIDVPGTEPVRWRVVSIEYGGGIAPVCSATSFTLSSAATWSLPEGPGSFPTHRLDPEVFGPDARDETGLYDCCPRPWIEVWSEELAAYLVELLNGDADRDARVRAAALAEARDALDRIADTLEQQAIENDGRAYGMSNPTVAVWRSAADELNRLAAAPNPTTQEALPFGGHHESCAYVAGIGPHCTCT